MTQTSLNARTVAEFCQARAMEYRRLGAHERATAFASSKDRDKAIEFEAKAQAIEQLATDLLSGRISESPGEVTSEIDNLAREISPQCFADYEAMILRLRNQGHDDGHAIRSAQAVYGADMETAQQIARESIGNILSGSPEDNGAYDQGFLDAAAWHEQRARDADTHASRETIPDRAVKFRKRAERHRLYARSMRSEFEAFKARRRSEMIENLRQASLKQKPAIGDSGIPIEVQYAFLKRKGDLPDETFD